MSQAFVDNVYDSTFEVQTTMANVEKNFAALKSSFSGANAPSDPIAGMWWFDTTANILKLRNEANAAWQSVWDFANNKPVITNIVSADFGAALKDPVAATAGLRTLGTGAAQALPGNTDLLPDAYVSQAKLKTSQGSVNVQGSQANIALPGGEYGFYPQTKTSSANLLYEVLASIAGGDGTAGSTSYITNIFLGCENVAIGTGYAQQRYVTSSGEVFWIFVLRDKITKDIKAMYQAPDHPCFGNGGKPLLVSHPFGSYDPETQEIIVINPTHAEVEAMKKMGERGEDEPDKDLLEVIMEEYELDETSKPVWPKIPVTVRLPKDYEIKQMGESVVPIKKIIPQPVGILCKSLKKKEMINAKNIT